MKPKLTARERYDRRVEREATALIKEVKDHVHHVKRVLIKEKGKRDLIQTVTHRLANGRVRTSGGDTWLVADYNRGGIDYVAV